MPPKRGCNDNYINYTTFVNSPDSTERLERPKGVKRLKSQDAQRAGSAAKTNGFGDTGGSSEAPLIQRAAGAQGVANSRRIDITGSFLRGQACAMRSADPTADDDKTHSRVGGE